MEELDSLKVESGSVLEKFIQSNTDVMKKEFSNVEMVLGGIERTFKQFQSKKKRVDLVNRVIRYLNTPLKDVPDHINSYIDKIHGRKDILKLGGDTKEDLIEYEQNLHNFTFAASHLDSCLWERYYEAQKLESVNKFDTSKFEYIVHTAGVEDDEHSSSPSPSNYDLEEVAAEAFLAMNSDPDEYTDKSSPMIAASFTKDKEEENKKYQFDSWLKESSILSEEEANAEDERLEALQIQAKNERIESGSDLEGGTMGIDDIYEDSYNGQGNKYHRSKPRKKTEEDENEWFGTYYHKYRNKNKDTGSSKGDAENPDGWVEVGDPQLISWDDEET